MSRTVVPYRFRRCTVCEHYECPCCGVWCDQDNAEGTGMCDCEFACTYADPLDVEGAARIEVFQRPGFWSQDFPELGVIVFSTDDEDIDVEITVERDGNRFVVVELPRSTPTLPAAPKEDHP
jgi:hypothetical protein